MLAALPIDLTSPGSVAAHSLEFKELPKQLMGSRRETAVLSPVHDRSAVDKLCEVNSNRASVGELTSDC